MKYTYLATLVQNSKGQYEVEFPDLAPAAATYGNNLEEAVRMAHDALTGYLLVAEDSKDQIPTAHSEREITIPEHALVVPIVVDTVVAREREENKLVKKTLTIPEWLNVLGTERGINFSATLTKALKEKLGV